MTLANKIWVVDDDPLLSSTLVYTLETSGYSVESFARADEVITALKSSSSDEPPQIMILDMGMPPHKHGPEEGLRVLDYLSEYQLPTKTLVLTGQDAEKMALLAVEHGAFDYLQKPVDESSLLNAVKRAQLFYEQEQKLQSQNQQQIKLNVQLGEGVKQVRNQAEEKIVRRVLQQTGFNVHETARQLGLKRENVYYLMNKYGIQRPEDGSGDE